MKILVLVLLAGAVGAAAYHPGGQARLRLLAAKIQGRLQPVSWSEVLASMPVQRWRESRPNPHPFDLVSGQIKFVRIEPESSCPVLWSTPLGEIWGRMKDENTLEWLVNEQLELRVYDNDHVHVKPGDTVLDVGGHLGTFADFALNQSAGKVIVFEPEPTNLECLRKTFAEQIKAGKVVIVAAAVADHSGELRFAQDTSVHGSARGKLDDSGSLVVPATTIDETVASLGLDAIDFVKMDIEGGERLALAGAPETLARFTPKMSICVYHRADDRAVIPPLVLGMQPEYEHTMGHSQAYFFSAAVP